MKKILRHFKTYALRGLIALIPLVLTFFVVHLLYVGIDQRVMRWIDRYIGYSIPGMGIFLVVVALYLTGIIASNVIGKQALNWLERLTKKLPIINTTYHIGKQLSETLSLPARQVFKRAVLVDYLKPGIWTVGFVTGVIYDRKNNDEKLLKVFVPTPPNPTSGTMVIVRESQTRDPGWTIDQAMRAVISGGIIGPDEIR